MDNQSLLSNGNYFKQHPENDFTREFEFTDENGTNTKRRLTVAEAVAMINAPVDQLIIPCKNESSAETLPLSSTGK